MKKSSKLALILVLLLTLIFPTEAFGKEVIGETSEVDKPIAVEDVTEDENETEDDEEKEEETETVKDEGKDKGKDNPWMMLLLFLLKMCL